MKQQRQRSWREMGKTLQKIRMEKKIPQDVIIQELKDMRVQCSKPNLSKLERGHISIRADILGALCLIYEVKPDVVLYKYKK